ncbi:hypothetical protein D3C78_918630 [compost metagenome]
MQAAVDPGGRAGRGEQAAVLDIEHIGIHLHVRIARGELFCPGPVGGCPPSRQQAGLGQHEGAEAQANHLRATVVGRDQGCEQRLGRSFHRVAPAGHDHRLCPLQSLQSVIDRHPEARRGAQQTGLRRAHLKLERRHAGVMIAEHHAGHRQVKGADAVEGDHGDRMTRHARFPLLGLHRMA